MTVDRKVLDFRAHGARRFDGKVCVVAGAGQGMVVPLPAGLRKKVE